MEKNLEGASKENTLEDLIVQELIMAEYIRRLLAPAKEQQDYPLMPLKDYTLNIIPECAPIGHLRSPVLFEMARIVNKRVLPAGPFLSKAGFYMFGSTGSDETHFIDTGSLRQLLLDNRGNRIVRACYGGRAVMIALDKQLLLDSCVAG